MKTYFLKQSVIVAMMSLCCSTFVGQADAQIASSSPSPQQKNLDAYAGYTQPLVLAPDVSPYGIVTGDNIIPLVVGYGLLTKPPLVDNLPYNAPYEPASPSPSNDTPTIAAETATQFLLGSMLQMNMTDDELKNYSAGLATTLSAMDAAALAPLSSSSSYNSVGNVGDKNAFTVPIGQVFANPYDAQSLFNYVPAASHGVSSGTNPAEIYISLVGGALTPVPVPSPLGDDFKMQLRRVAAIQTAGINALQDIFDRSKPVLAASDADNMKNTLQTLGDTSIATSPTTKRDFERIMATHRLDPNNSWYTHVQQASPVELQRQQLYLQAETLYELYQIRQEQEQNKMLLAITLLAQNYQNRSALNIQSKMSPSALAAASATSGLTATGLSH